MRKELRRLLHGWWVFVGLVLSASALADPPPTNQWVPVPAFSDEFTGAQLDSSKWNNTNASYLGNPPGAYSSKNVRVRNGMLELWAKSGSLPHSPPAYHDYTVAYVGSKQPILYGYFEVRAKPMAIPIDCAFWFYRSTQTGTYEVDAFEIGAGAPGQESIVHTNTWIYLGDPALENSSNNIGDPYAWPAPVPLADDFHVYGLEWNAAVLNFYFDGQLIRSKANTYWNVPMTMIFTTETQPNWFGLPTTDQLPAVFLIDYVRVWQSAN